MHSDDNLWYRVGYALERTRNRAPALAGALERITPSGRGGSGDERAPERDRLIEVLLLGGAGALASRLLKLWPARRRPGLLALAAAGASGAGAGLLVELLHPLLRGELRPPGPDAEPGTSMLSGAGRGLAYGSVVEPRLPGPDVVRGIVFGTLEYLVAPWGGLPGLLGSSSPHRKLPLVSDLLEPERDDDAAYLDFIAFGVAVAFLYGLAREKSGTTDEA